MTHPLRILLADDSVTVLPQSVVEFTSIAEDPEAGPHQLAAPIEADSALTSELLRQVNSIGTGLRQKVSSISQAINLFGPRRTKTLVLNLTVNPGTLEPTRVISA